MLLHPPYPFVTSRVVSTALLTCCVSTCCNIDTLVLVSLRVLKFRFLGCIFGGRFCVYITQMNFHFYRFSSFFILSRFVYFAPFPILFCFVLLSLIRAACPIVFCAIVSRGGVVSLLTHWLTCHVNELPRYHITTLSSCHIICGCGLKCRRRATLFCD